MKTMHSRLLALLTASIFLFFSVVVPLFVTVPSALAKSVFENLSFEWDGSNILIYGIPGAKKPGVFAPVADSPKLPNGFASVYLRGGDKKCQSKGVVILSSSTSGQYYELSGANNDQKAGDGIPDKIKPYLVQDELRQCVSEGEGSINGTIKGTPGVKLSDTAVIEARQVPIAGQIGNFYAWALGIGALIALGVLIFGGILYTISAGNASRQGDAKEWIFGAVIGLFLLFGALLILKTINPNLTKLRDINLLVNKPGSTPATNTPPSEQEVSLPPPLPASLSGGCNSCTDISAIKGIIIKNNKLANIEVAKKLAILVDLTKNNSNLSWRVTEAFPPTVKHISSCHYDGTCVDIALLDNPPTCAQVDGLERLAGQAGFVIVNEYSGCGGTQFSTTTGGHLHIR